MSLDARLRQGLIATADSFDINADLDLINIRAAARVRERRHVFIAAFAGAAAAAFLFVAGPRIADTILGLEIYQPVPPAEDRIQQEESERNFDPDDVRKADRRADRRQRAIESGRRPFAFGGRPGSAPSRSGSTGPGEDQADEVDDPGTKHQSRPPRERTMSQDYQAAGLDAASQYNCPSDLGSDVGCVEFMARSYERFLSLTVSDTSDNQVAVVVGIDANNNGKIEDNFEICGSTDGFVRIPAGARIEIQLFADNDSCGQGNGPTRGRVVATFTDRLE